MFREIEKSGSVKAKSPVHLLESRDAFVRLSAEAIHARIYNMKHYMIFTFALVLFETAFDDFANIL
jgi:hypothetical protein